MNLDNNLKDFVGFISEVLNYTEAELPLTFKLDELRQLVDANLSLINLAYVTVNKDLGDKLQRLGQRIAVAYKTPEGIQLGKVIHTLGMDLPQFPRRNMISGVIDELTQFIEASETEFQSQFHSQKLGISILYNHELILTQKGEGYVELEEKLKSLGRRLFHECKTRYSGLYLSLFIVTLLESLQMKSQAMDQPLKQLPQKYERPSVGEPIIPEELWEQIFIHAAAGKKNKEALQLFGKFALVSKDFQRFTFKAKKQWGIQGAISLKNFHCKTAKEAIEFLSKEPFPCANLEEYPDLEDADLVTLFQTCPWIQDLRIKSEKITKIPPEAKNLKKLICADCPELEQIPSFLIKLEKLKCSNCPKITDISNFEKLEVLIASNCFRLAKLENLPCLEVLNVSRTPFKKLERFKNLESLTCEECPDLLEISDLPNLRWLSCKKSQQLHKLLGVTNLVELSIDGCNFAEIPLLSNLKKLSCKEMPNLREIPALSNLESLVLDQGGEMTLDPSIPLKVFNGVNFEKLF